VSSFVLPSALLVLLTNPAAEYRSLLSIDPSLQRIRWRVDATSPWNTSRVFTWGEVVVLGTPSGDVVAYCQDSGAVAWTRTVKGPVRSVGGSANTLLVGTRTGDLYALRAPRSC